MKNSEELEDSLQRTIITEQIYRISEISAVTKNGMKLRKFFHVDSLASLGLTINACTSTGYVETEPAHLEYNRPPQPSATHIWINENWQYNQQKNIYVHKNGYWAKPGRHRSYVPGYWQTGPRGSCWVSGHYERNHR